MTVGAVEMAIRALLLAPGRSLVVTVNGGGDGCSDGGLDDLSSLLSSCKEDGRPLICAANHNTFLDAPLLAPMIGRATTKASSAHFSWSRSFLPWMLEYSAWPFTAASASLLFQVTSTSFFF